MENKDINTELLYALEKLIGEISIGKLSIRKDFHLLNAHACAVKAVRKAKGE